MVNASAIPIDEAIRRIKDAGDAGLKDALARSLYDLGWFEVYFAHDAAAAAKWIDAMKQLTPADNPVLRRLEAWLDLVGGKKDAARVIFTAQKDSDPLSALGLFFLEDQEKHSKETEALGR